MVAPRELCQLAGVWDGTKLFEFPIMEQKIDGWRALYLRGRDGTRGLYTRNGHPLHGVDHIVHRLKLMEEMAGCEMVFDGEVQVDGTLKRTKRWFEAGWKQGGEKGIFFGFDCMPRDEWLGGGSARRLFDRKKMLRELAAQCEDHVADDWTWRPGSYGRDELTKPVHVLPDSLAIMPEDVVAAARAVWMAGGEGVMVKDANSPYQRSRSKSWLKVKQKQAWQRKWREAIFGEGDAYEERDD